MEPADVLRRALQAVGEAGLSEDLREVGFARAIDLVVGSNAGTAKAADGGSGAAAAGPDRQLGRQQVGSADKWERVGSALGVSAEQAARLFDEHEGDLQFVGDLEKLGRSAADKVRNLATLYAAARQGGQYDDGPTSADAIRTELNRHGLVDSNYSRYMKEIKGSFNVNGTGRNLSYKIKYQGRNEAKRIAEAVLEG